MVQIGRYVVVSSPDVTAALSLCEVEIYSAGPLVSKVQQTAPMTDAEWRCISQGRPTRQSSQHWRYGSDLAVDGSRANSLQLGSCTHTLEEESPWWRVALDGSMKVHAVVITNRGDAHGVRLSGAQACGA